MNCFIASAQNNVQRPKLVVGLVLDQMRWDYLYRFQDRYSAYGFNRLLKQGFSYENAHYPYMPTVTAVGHTTLYTGSVPALHGIVGNNWMDKKSNKNIYCTSDSTVQGVGGSGIAGQQSPRNLWATTITDELRMATNFRSKTIGIAVKDRGSILPAGHSATASYWYDKGNFITSTYYTQSLPKWVNDFNAKKRVDALMKNGWKTLYPINTYKNSTEDAKDYEAFLPGTKSNTFPYDFSDPKMDINESIKTTPFGNTLTFEMAEQAVINEKLGQTGNTDFLAVSFSSTDYIGHSFGPNSIEIEDTYLRFDRDLANFLTFLDKQVGAGNYLLFLSADHAVQHVPQFLNEHGIPGGTYNESKIQKMLNDTIGKQFGVSNPILAVMNYQIYIDKKYEDRKPELIPAILKIVRQDTMVSQAFELENMEQTTLPKYVKEMVVNGYNQNRSGDIQVIVKPGYIDGWGKGTTHSAWNPNDSHVPLMFFGWKVKPGLSYKNVKITDLAPTLAAKLKIQMPNASIGNVLEEVVK